VSPFQCLRAGRSRQVLDRLSARERPPKGLELRWAYRSPSTEPALSAVEGSRLNSAKRAAPATKQGPQTRSV
jgi:hypothetical protein